MDELNRLRFLVIEDESDTARMIATLLERRFGASVELASDCTSARKALDGSSYDLVTLDYQLPDGSGLDMLDEITAAESHPPVVMITGHGDEELAYLAFRMGAAGYAAKNRKLSVVLPDAVEWAMADAKLKKSGGRGKSDSRLEGLTQATHAVSRDLRLEIETIKSARQRLDRAMGASGPEAEAKARRTATAIDRSLAKALALIDKLDSLVSPETAPKKDPRKTV